MAILLRRGIIPPLPATYTGPGDITSGAAGWWGVRGYNAAYSGNVADLLDQAGANPLTVGLVNHRLDTATISAWVTAHSVTTIKVTKLYDQSGTGLHVSQSTLADMPALVLNILSGYPVIRFSAQAGMPSSGGATVNQPITSSIVSSRTGAFTSYGTVLGVPSSGSFQNGYNNVANQIFQYSNGAGTDTASVTDSTFHALAFALNNPGPNGTFYVDASSTAMTPANVGTVAIADVLIGNSGDGHKFTGDLTEVGFWGVLFSGTDATNMSNNQHGASGYNF
jgi:hypothetical protein